MIKKFFKIIFFIFILVSVFYFFIIQSEKPNNIKYGASFNTLYARELKLDWKEVYDSMIFDLGIKKIRLAAHWDMVEPVNDKFNFEELDYQLKIAEENDVEVIFAVGKRLPRWPECHIPEWAFDLSKEEEQEEVLQYIEKVINRYKSFENIDIWQVENEPYLKFFAKDHCGDFDEDFLNKEINLVKNIDSSREIMVTDSGEISFWNKAYGKGDVFGTTLYVYAWNNILGNFRNPVLPGFYTARKNIFDFIYGEKEAIIAELALEPWLNKPVVEEDLDVQMQRMSKEKFNNVLEFAEKTNFETQYLWGVEWWYYMKTQGEDWYWNRGKEIFN